MVIAIHMLSLLSEPTAASMNFTNTLGLRERPKGRGTDTRTHFLKGKPEILPVRGVYVDVKMSVLEVK